MNADSVGGVGAGVRSRLAGFRLASLFLLASLGLPSGSLAMRRPMNLDDMYNFKDLTQEAISPDGRQIAYVLSLPGGKENKGLPATRLWLLDVASGKSRALAAARNVSDLAWSPDGRTLAYIGSRDGGPEVWLKPLPRARSALWFHGSPGRTDIENTRCMPSPGLPRELRSRASQADSCPGRPGRPLPSPRS